MTKPGRWQVRLASAAENDTRAILRWTTAGFGVRQARTYARTLSLATEALTGGADVAGSRRRDYIGPGLRTLHVARRGRKGSHFLLYRITSGGDPLLIDVVRILHDRMDLPARGAELEV
ncbi:MAG: type II toxin-antitoxin system RelE/ParE family toxin [Spirochaetaceae bacterium]|nr:type II toxin-antitoxin system RelE/ParE family toxin [Spirochaetaceae bacterium]